MTRKIVAVASLLHDVGLTKKYQGKRRFEVEGADAARALAKAEAWTTGELSSSGTPSR